MNTADKLSEWLKPNAQRELEATNCDKEKQAEQRKKENERIAKPSRILGTIFLPHNLDLNALKLPEGIKIQHLQSILYIISETAPNKKIDGSYAAISGAILKNHMRNYHDKLSFLMNEGIIERNGIYKAGKKSMGYRFTEKYRNVEFREVKAAPSLRRHKRNEKAELICEKDQKPVDDLIKSMYGFFIDWFDGLEIDYDAAIKYLNAQPKPASSHTLTAVRKIYEKDFFYKLDRFGRMHTSVVLLRKDLRQFLRCKGKPLVSIDVKNCQPYILLELLNSIFLKGEHKSSKELPHTFNIIEEKNILSQIKIFFNRELNNNTISINNKSIFYMIKQWAVNHAHSPFKNDLAFYQHLVSTGTFKTYMMDEFEKEFGIKVSADDAKLLNFKIFFSKNHAQSPQKKLFKKLFPIVYQVLLALRKRNHKNAAALLQIHEAKAMLDCAARRISELHPDVPMFPVHDAIFTTEGNEETVKSLIESTLADIVGVAPTVSVERFNNCAAEISVHTNSVYPENSVHGKSVHPDNLESLHPQKCASVSINKNSERMNQQENKFEEVKRVMKQVYESGQNVNAKKIADVGNLNRRTVTKHFEEAKKQLGLAINKNEEIEIKPSAINKAEVTGVKFVEQKKESNMYPAAEKYIQKRNEIEAQRKAKAEAQKKPAIAPTEIPDVNIQQEIISAVVEDNTVIVNDQEYYKWFAKVKSMATPDMSSPYAKAFIITTAEKRIERTLFYTQELKEPIRSKIFSEVFGKDYEEYQQKIERERIYQMEKTLWN